MMAYLTKRRKLLPVVLVWGIGWTLLASPPWHAGAETMPQPVYRVAIGAELDEINRSIQQLQYQYQQLLLLKRMVQTGNWGGVGRMIGDPGLTGLVERLEMAVQATKRIAEDFRNLHPGYEPPGAGSASDYARQLARRLEASRRGKTNLLQIMNERYADSVVTSRGDLEDYHRGNSIPAYIGYTREVNKTLGGELKRINEDSESGLIRAVQLNSQVALTSQACLLQILQAISDQNRILALIAADLSNQ